MDPGGGPGIATSDFLGGGGYPPSGTAVFLGGGRPDPPEATDPQKSRLERGKEAKASQFPLESHFFTTNFMN